MPDSVSGVAQPGNNTGAASEHLCVLDFCHFSRSGFDGGGESSSSTMGPGFLFGESVTVLGEVVGIIRLHDVLIAMRP
jgi:hypothetical protein